MVHLSCNNMKETPGEIKGEVGYVNRRDDKRISDISEKNGDVTEYV